MKTESSFVVYNNNGKDYIYIYYSYKGNTLKINTRSIFQKSYCKVEKNGNIVFKDTKKDAMTLNMSMQGIKRNVDYYIREKLKRGQIPTQKECNDFLNHKFSFEKAIDFRTPMQHFDVFLNIKEKELQNKASLKDYKSLKNALTDYIDEKKKPFYFNDINYEFMLNFRDFLQEPHPKTYLTKGNLNDNTINKRIGALRTFLKYIQENKIHTFDLKVLNFHIKKHQSEIIALSIEELKQLYEFDKFNEKDKYIIDLFLLNCFMGLRDSDFRRLKKGEFVKDAENNLYYVKVNQKTQTRIQIPIVSTAQKILEKYDYNIKVYTNQVLNKRIKDILKRHKLFETTVKTTEKRKGKIIVTESFKREMISTHTCRRTFITLAVNKNIPLNAIMAATGHTQLSTLQKYISKNQNHNDFKKIDF